MKKLSLIVVSFVLVSLISLSSGETEVIFSTDWFSDCIGGYWWDESGESWDGRFVINVCNQVPGFSEGDKGCCPKGFKCVGSEGVFICETDPDDACFNILACDHYGSEDGCENDLCGLARRKEYCGGYREVLDICKTYLEDYVIDQESCKCYWDETESSCKHTSDVIPVTQTIINEEEVQTCETTTTGGGECVDGKMTLEIISKIIWRDLTAYITPTVTAEMIRDSCSGYLCPSGTKEIRCGDLRLKLSFFGWASFIFAVFVLIAVYFYYYKRDSKNRKVKRIKRKIKL